MHLAAVGAGGARHGVEPTGSQRMVASAGAAGLGSSQPQVCPSPSPSSSYGSEPETG